MEKWSIHSAVSVRDGKPIGARITTTVKGTGYYDGKKIAVALCGDLWTEGRPEEMKALNPDVVLWPVWCDFPCQEWNQKVKYEYAQQAACCGERVLYVNPFCMDTWARDAASGGAAYFQGGTVMAELPAGKPGVLIVSI